MRQAYDYWQDQPECWPCKAPTTQHVWRPRALPVFRFSPRQGQPEPRTGPGHRCPFEPARRASGRAPWRISSWHRYYRHRYYRHLWPLLALRYPRVLLPMKLRACSFFEHCEQSLYFPQGFGERAVLLQAPSLGYSTWARTHVGIPRRGDFMVTDGPACRGSTVPVRSGLHLLTRRARSPSPSPEG